MGRRSRFHQPFAESGQAGNFRFYIVTLVGFGRKRRRNRRLGERNGGRRSANGLQQTADCLIGSIFGRTETIDQRIPRFGRQFAGILSRDGFHQHGGVVVTRRALNEKSNANVVLIRARSDLDDHLPTPTIKHRGRIVAVGVLSVGERSAGPTPPNGREIRGRQRPASNLIGGWPVRTVVTQIDLGNGGRIPEVLLRGEVLDGRHSRRGGNRGNGQKSAAANYGMTGGGVHASIRPVRYTSEGRVSLIGIVHTTATTSINRLTERQIGE
jgi:hypothetical protein